MLAASRFLARLRPTIIHLAEILPCRLDMSPFLASAVRHKLPCLDLAYYLPLI